MNKGCGNDDTRAKVLCNKEGPFRNQLGLASLCECREYGAWGVLVSDVDDCIAWRVVMEPCAVKK
jgi:hypothetical protein